ncbi:MAG: hypothetical protein JRH16_15515 [Deltaproteobacteria bacterium]|nr:hypothetical protein [Deltaproteobacteria bacterium]
MQDEAWARYVLVFIPLVAIVLARESTAAPRRDGLLLLVAALGIELFCLAGSTTRMARPAFPLAILGLCRAFGLARGRTAVLAFWLVPLPWMVLKLTSPDLERTWLQLAAGLLSGMGAELEVQRSSLRGAAGVLGVQASDSGLRLAVLLSGLGWYASLRRNDSLAACVRRALIWGALGLPAQALGTLLAVAVLAMGHSAAARALLDPGLWLVLALLGVARSEQLARQRPQRHPDGVDGTGGSRTPA